MDKRPYVSQSQLLNEQSNEIACGITHDDGSIGATELSSNQMDFQTMKSANDTAKVSDDDDLNKNYLIISVPY